MISIKILEKMVKVRTVFVFMMTVSVPGKVFHDKCPLPLPTKVHVDSTLFI